MLQLPHLFYRLSFMNMWITSIKLTLLGTSKILSFGKLMSAYLHHVLYYFLHSSGRILVFYGVRVHLLYLFSPGSGQMMDPIDTILRPVVLERKGVKNNVNRLFGKYQ